LGPDLPPDETCAAPKEPTLATLGGYVAPPRALGPWLFVGVGADVQTCGAERAVHYPTFLTYDAGHGVRPMLAPPASDEARIAALANAALERDYGGERHCMYGEEAPELYSTELAYDAHGELRASYAWSRPALTFMCAPGIDYWVSMLLAITTLDDAAVPREAEPWRRAPAWLAPYLAAHAAEVRGVVPLPPELDRTRAAATFETPMPEGIWAIPPP
jgi:hypothetical protein